MGHTDMSDIPVMVEFRIVLNHIKGKAETHYVPYVPGWTIYKYLDKIGLPFSNCVAYINGKEVKKSHIVGPEDKRILIAYEVGLTGVIGAVKTFFALSWVKAIGTALTWLGVGYSVYSAFQKPKLPSFNTIGEGLEEGSPTYGWDGVQTTQDVGLAVPIVYGEHKVGGNIINQYIWDNGDKSYLNVLLGLCEGEIEEVRDIKINDNPIDNYGSDVQSYVRLGSNEQEIVPGFGDLHHNNSVNVQLTQNNSYVYTTSLPNVEAFELHFRLPNGLFQQASNGAIESWFVDYRVEYKLHTESTWIDLGVNRIRAKSRSALRRVFRKEGLSPGQYDIRITRVSADSDFTHIGDLYLVNVDEITTEDLTYPNTALLGLRMLASEKLSGGVPQISCVVKGKKVRCPIIKDDSNAEVPWDDYYWDGDNGVWKRIGDGTVLHWDGEWGERWCGNPVWCLRDLLTNRRYGLGRYITESLLDDTQLMEVAKYCEEGVDDGNGGIEKRFRLDVVIDSQTKALDLVVQLLATFRGMAIYGEGSVKIDIDRPKNPMPLFGMGNVVKGSFVESWRAINENPNWVEVIFLNKDKNYEQDIVCVVDNEAILNGEPVRKKQIRVFTTNKNQAYRIGKYALEVGKRIVRHISFRTGIEGCTVEPGDVFLFSHDVPMWGDSGRVVGGDVNTVVLDKKVVIEDGKSYQVAVRFSDDSIEVRNVTNSAGETDTLTVSPSFSQSPQRYDVWSFGEANRYAKPFRCISVQNLGTGEVEIEAVEYDESVYGDSVEDIVDNYSSLEAGLPNVSDLSAVERVITLPDGTVEEGIDVYFEKPDLTNYVVKSFAGVNIYLSDSGGESWEYKGFTAGESFSIVGGLSVGNTYRIAVVSVSKDGEERDIGLSPYVDITLTGKGAGPSVPGNFSYEFGEQLILKWDKVDEPDVAGYEIRTVDNSWGVDNGDLLYRGLVNKFVYRPNNRDVGNLYLRAFNTSGIYSGSSAVVHPINSQPPAPTISVMSYFNQAKVSWDDVVDNDVDHYEVWGSLTNDWAGEEFLLAKVKGKSAIVKIDNDPTYIRVRAVDYYGPGAWSNTVIANKVGVTGDDLEDGSITETKIADGAVTAPKLYAGEVITLSAQIKEGIIEDAHILNLSADKIKGGTIEGEEIVLQEGGVFRSADYDEIQKKGFKIDGEDGIKLFKGRVDADITLIEGASLRQQFEVTPSNTLHDTVSEFDDSSATKTNVVVEGEENAPAVILIDGQTSGEYISAPINVNNAELGTIQWQAIYPSSLDLAYTYGTADAYWEQGATRDDSEVSGDSNAIDGNDGTRVDYGDGTHKWGWHACCQVDLGEPRYVNKFRVKCVTSKAWKVQCSDDGVNWVDVTGWINSEDYTGTIARHKKRYWRWYGDTNEEYYDYWTIYTFSLYYDGEGASIKVYTRTADNSSMSGASDWEPTDGYDNPAGSQIVSPKNLYLQYRLVFSVSSGGSPYVKWVKVNYDALKIKTGLIKYDDVTIKQNADGRLYAITEDGSVSQIKLKTATGTGGMHIYTDTAGENEAHSAVLPGGEYGFYPTTHYQTNTDDWSWVLLDGVVQSSVYAPRIAFARGGSTKFGSRDQYTGDFYIYWKQRYVTASGRIHWIYLLLDTKDKVESIWVAPDHPSANVSATHEEIPHPFDVKDDYKVVLVDEDILDEVKRRVIESKGRKTPAEIIMTDFVLDDWVRPKFTPREIIKIDEWDAYEGERVADIKVPQWCRVMFNSERVCLKRIIIDKLPPGIEFRKMRLKDK